MRNLYGIETPVRQPEPSQPSSHEAKCHECGDPAPKGVYQCESCMEQDEASHD
jgi:ribosomal protein S14